MPKTLNLPNELYSDHKDDFHFEPTIQNYIIEEGMVVNIIDPNDPSKNAKLVIEGGKLVKKPL